MSFPPDGLGASGDRAVSLTSGREPAHEHLCLAVIDKRTIDGLQITPELINLYLNKIEMRVSKPLRD